MIFESDVGVVFCERAGRGWRLACRRWQHCVVVVGPPLGRFCAVLDVCEGGLEVVMHEVPVRRAVFDWVESGHAGATAGLVRWRVGAGRGYGIGAVFSCVGVAKAALRVRAPLVQTPLALYRLMRRGGVDQEWRHGEHGQQPEPGA